MRVPVPTLVVLIAFAITSCDDPAVSVTPGATVTSERSIREVYALNVGDGFAVDVTVGDTEALKIEAPEGYQQYITSEVRAGRLLIGLDPKVRNDNFGPRKAHLTIVALGNITASGASIVESSDTIRGAGLSVEATGASRIKVPVRVGGVSCSAREGSVVSLGGIADHMSISSFSGASQLAGFDLATVGIAMIVSGSSRLEVRASGTLDVVASGASTIYYKGHPTITSNLSDGSTIIDAN